MDVSSWKFTRDSAWLVGPIVGKVASDGSEARLLVEASRAVEAEVAVSIEGQAVAATGSSALTGTTAGEGATNGNGAAAASASDVHVAFKQQQSLKPGTPTPIVLRNLTAGKRVHVSITLDGETRKACFKTPDPRNTKWEIGLVSCNKISTMADIGLWEDLAPKAPGLDCILHLGDQVYGDEDFGRGLSTAKEEEIDERPESKEGCWGKSRELVMQYGSDKDLEPLRPQIREIYRNLYRATWSHPPCASTLAATSNLMILDDHELVDDCGDVPAHSDRSSWQYFVMSCAYQVYREYQSQLNYEVKDVDDYEDKVWWHTILYPGVGLIMMDMRLQRSLHRHQMANMDWTDREYMGPAQFAGIQNILNTEFRDVHTLMMGIPTPPLFLNTVATSMVRHVADDVVGSWGNPKFAGEHTAFLEMLSKWQEDKPNRAVCMAAGDIHIGGMADVQLRSGGALLNQVVSSAIGNLPEGGGTALNLFGNAMLKIADMHFKMRVHHDSWILESNYAVVHVDQSDASTRPAITAELFGKNSYTKKDFEYTLPEGLATACHGCKCTIS